MRKQLILFTFFFTLTVQAKDYTVVVKGTSTTPKGKTEVTSTGIGASDTISVKPGADTSTIYVTVEDSDGNVLSGQSVPTGIPANTYITIPQSPEGAVLRIRDDNGLVYEED